MDADLEPVYQRVSQAVHPEDVFGFDDVVLPAETILRFLAARYEEFKARANPAVYFNPEDVEAASEARLRLDRFYDEAKERVRRYVYGIKGYNHARSPSFAKSFDVGRNRFYIGRLIGRGDHSTMYEACMETDGKWIGEVVIKLASSDAQSQFLENEDRILDILHQKDVPQWKHLPFVFARFQSGGRSGLVLRDVSGFNLQQVRHYHKHQDGVDQKHMVWMLDRALSALGYVHSRGIVHANLTPEHLIVQPDLHNAILCGWAGAAHKPAITGEKVREFSDVFSPPEVKAGGKIGPWSDIYSLGKLMIWTLGGDPADNTVPAHIEVPIEEYLHRMVQESPTSRPYDAWELHAEQSAIKDSLWPRRFLHFDMGIKNASSL